MASSCVRRAALTAAVVSGVDVGGAIDVSGTVGSMVGAIVGAVAAVAGCAATAPAGVVTDGVDTSVELDELTGGALVVDAELLGDPDGDVTRVSTA